MPVTISDFAGFLKILTIFLNFLVKFVPKRDVFIHILYNECLKVGMLYMVEKLRLWPFQRYAARFCSFTGRGEIGDYFWGNFFQNKTIFS